ncbi:MAG: hypothetical protein L0221_17625 [Chloroflexi bacterium]|nr:hypothetical protein [Chloroflexota bacterium]
MRRFIVLLAAVALLAAIPAGVAARPGPTSARAVDPAVAYWTAARIANAIPRDFIRTASGKFVPAAKPPGTPGGGGGSGSGAVTGKSWAGGETVVKQSGRVLFRLSGVDYICSASVVDDGADATYAVIVTAAHCIYDEVADVFATNWVYYPSFDTSPTYTCAQSTYGCWSARALVVHRGYAQEESFNGTTVQFDWGFAVVRTGGHTGTTQLDASLGSYAIDTSVLTQGPNPGWAFGYPAAGKYHGLDLTYCKGAVGTDPYNDDKNWRLGCDMTGGSSGGPWLKDTNDPGTLATEGTVFSVNSYGYNGVKAMHGPRFNANTTATYNAALSATPGTTGIVGITVN